LFKSLDVIDAIKLEFEKYKKSIHQLNKFLPSDAQIHRFADDYGVIDLLLCLQEPRRKITVNNSDSYKRSVAQHNYLLKFCKVIYDSELTVDPSILIITTIFTQEEFDAFMMQYECEIIVIELGCFKGRINECYQLSCSLGKFEVYKKMNNGEKI